MNMIAPTAPAVQSFPRIPDAPAVDQGRNAEWAAACSQKTASIRRSASRIADNHADIVREVEAAVRANDVVIVGMKQNPFPRRARKALAARGISCKYLEFGSYLSQWRRRNALKMWTGWPTLPMIFVKGVLVGGATDLDRLIDSGELSRMLPSG